MNLDTEFQQLVVDEEITVDFKAIYLNDQEDNVYLYQYEDTFFITVDCHMAAGIYADAEQYDDLSGALRVFTSIVEEQNETRTDNGFEPVMPRYTM